MSDRVIKLTLPYPPTTNNMYFNMTHPPKAPAIAGYHSAAVKGGNAFEHENRCIREALTAHDGYVAGFKAGAHFERQAWLPITKEKPRSFRVPSEDLKTFKTRVENICVKARVEPFVGEVGVQFKIFRPRRIGDLDGTFKAILDALKGFAYYDDKQITAIYAERFEDKEAPRAEVLVWARGLI